MVLLLFFSSQVLNPITKYALTMTPVMLSLEELLPFNLRESYSVSLIVRTILVFSTLVVSLAVPFFGKFIILHCKHAVFVKLGSSSLSSRRGENQSRLYRIKCKMY